MRSKEIPVSLINSPNARRLKKLPVEITQDNFIGVEKPLKLKIECQDILGGDVRNTRPSSK